MKTVKILSAVAVVIGSSFLALVHAQSESLATRSKANDRRPTTNTSWTQRDPLTGRLYQQQIVNVSVPTTTWESKPVNQTVYVPQVVTKYVASQHTSFVPRTTYVMQQRVRGRLNPFRSTTVSYDYRPVTHWVPVTQTVSTPVATQQWVARQQTVYVSQPVQRMKSEQRLVQTEIPQPNLVLPVAAPLIAVRPPLVRIPLLAGRRVLGAAARPIVSQTGLRPITNTGPLASVKTASYSAPLRTASRNGAFARDTFQAGMSATVLR